MEIINFTSTQDEIKNQIRQDVPIIVIIVLRNQEKASNMEEFTIIPNYSRYLISKNGEVYSTYVNRLLKPATSKEGYLKLVLKSDSAESKTVLVHRLVALTYLPNPLEYEQVNHIDNIKLNNNVSNLEWCTCSQNNIHKNLYYGNTLLLICDRCGINFYRAYSRQTSEKYTFCSESCFRKEDVVKNVLSFDTQFLIWCQENYPLTYLGKLFSLSDNGLKKVLVKNSLKVEKVRNLLERPDTIEELLIIWQSFKTCK